ncbi:MAG: hypothetical protein OEZ54_02090 [Gemmatimonadota bacterium]|nr:hypothetical protein [Gemmatimonadota bacterium]
MTKAAWVLTAGLLFSGAQSGVSARQLPLDIEGYYLHLGLAHTSTSFVDRSAMDFQRIRLMASPSLGPLRFDLAYENTLSLSTTEATALSGLVVSSATGAFLPLQGTITQSSRTSWRHKLDRANVTLSIGEIAEVRIGRQPISWATTLFLTPTDPFSPFNPSDPFRAYRGGVDAARLQAFTGAFSSLELVVRPMAAVGDTTMTAAVRGHTVVSGWEVSAWTGILHDRWAGSVGVTKTISDVAIRAEGQVRETPTGTVLRYTLGADRRMKLFDRDLYVVLEYQHDGFGTDGPEDIPRVFLSEPYQLGEMQVIGKNVMALQGALTLTPLVSTEMFLLSNLGDPSLMVGSAASYVSGDESTIRVGLFWGLGTKEQTILSVPIPGSEFGALPLVGYGSFALFF